jgi:hypothetical protein
MLTRSWSKLWRMKIKKMRDDPIEIKDKLGIFYCYLNLYLVFEPFFINRTSCGAYRYLKDILKHAFFKS